MIILIVFNLFSTEMTIIHVSNPSLSIYEDLQHWFSATLRCPCTRTSIVYRNFISLAPIFHQVCSSDFVTDQWLEILRKGYAAEMDIDWRNKAWSQFQLLSNLCKFANQTVDDALRRLLTASFVTSNALTKVEFETQMNVVVTDFFRSTTNYFDLFVETASLLIQIDQPFMGLIHQSGALSDPELRLTAFVNQTDHMISVQVCQL